MQEERYFQFTAIDEYTRLRVIWFVKEHSSYGVSRFVDVIIKKFLFKIGEIQTDNGFEFTKRLSYNAKTREKKKQFQNKLEEK
jgi:hypothetical protein